MVIALNNIFFDFDKTTLKPESFPELNRIVTLMNERTSMQVDIAGHADATGEAKLQPQVYLNAGLRSVQKYLVGKGIAESRISVSFYGETKPVESNATKEGRRKNRRVEFKIVKP
jgi:OOP family OmpA-OmpF porin